MYLNQSVYLRNRIVTFLDIWILHRRHMGVSNHRLHNSTVCSTDCWEKYQRPRSWLFMMGIHGWPMVSPHKRPGPCITNVFATWRKNFSQWHRSFQRKLKFLRRVAKTLVIQGPVAQKTFPYHDVIKIYSIDQPIQACIHSMHTP